MLQGVSNLSRLMAEMERMKSVASATPTTSTSLSGSTGTGTVNFGEVLRGAVDSVNKLQGDAMQMAKAFEMGDGKVDITQVMITTQKANIAFQGMTQVRNKLIDAYKDIMNMPV